MVILKVNNEGGDLSMAHTTYDVWEHAEAQVGNLNRLTEGLARGLQMPVILEETGELGFVVRLDDAPFGPVAVVHLPVTGGVRVLYRDPDELRLILSSGALRIVDGIVV